MSTQMLVMGPDATTTRSSVLSPPKLTSETDKYQWRTDVKTWARIIKQYARGGDNRANGLMSALALTLYFSLARDQRNIVDNAVQCNQIPLNLEDEFDSEEKTPAATAKEQLKLVDDIIQLVAKDTPTDGIRRLVKTSQDIYQCIRTKSEKPHIFAKKFQGLAKRYLTMCSPSHGPQESQNFAILLLENAKLPSATFNNIVTQLVTKSTNRTENAMEATIIVPVSMFTDMLGRTAEALGAIMSWEASTGPTAHNKATQDLIDRSRSLATSVRTTVSDVRRTSEHQKANNRSDYAITLDDAVDALCDMKADEDVATRPPEHEGHNPVKKGAMMMKRGELKDNDRQPPAKKQKVYIPAGTGKKKNSICNSCKKQGHWKGDYECENHPMHEQWLAKKAEDKSDKQDNITSNPQYFQ